MLKLVRQMIRVHALVHVDCLLSETAAEDANEETLVVWSTVNRLRVDGGCAQHRDDFTEFETKFSDDELLSYENRMSGGRPII